MIDEAISAAKGAGTTLPRHRCASARWRSPRFVENPLGRVSARRQIRLREADNRRISTLTTPASFCEQPCECTRGQSMDKCHRRFFTDLSTANSGRCSHRSPLFNLPKFIVFSDLSTDPHGLLLPPIFKIKYRSIGRSWFCSTEPPPCSQNRNHTGCGDKGISWSSGYNRPNS